VFVYQLSKRATKEDLRDFFSRRGGSVRDVQIVMDRATNRSKGCAYVEFEKANSVLSAIQASGDTVAGGPIMVRAVEDPASTSGATAGSSSTSSALAGSTNRVRLPSIERFERDRESLIPARLLVENLNQNVGPDHLKTLFGVFGVIDQIEQVQPGADAVVYFEDEDAAHAAIEALQEFEFVDHKLMLSKLASGAPVPSSVTRGRSAARDKGSSKDARDAADRDPREFVVVALENLFKSDDNDPDLEQDVSQLVLGEMTQFGDVLGVVVERNTDGRVWVLFETEAAAKAALLHIGGRQFDGRTVHAVVDRKTVFEAAYRRVAEAQQIRNRERERERDRERDRDRDRDRDREYHRDRDYRDGDRDRHYRDQRDRDGYRNRDYRPGPPRPRFVRSPRPS
jgi:RNA recognition motif-containing protein